MKLFLFSECDDVGGARAADVRNSTDNITTNTASAEQHSTATLPAYLAHQQP